MSGQKLGHQVKSKEILVYTLAATFVKFCLSLNMGHVGSKTKSLGQILENSFTNITFTFLNYSIKI